MFCVLCFVFSCVLFRSGMAVYLAELRQKEANGGMLPGAHPDNVANIADNYVLSDTLRKLITGNAAFPDRAVQMQCAYLASHLARHTNRPICIFNLSSNPSVPTAISATCRALGIDLNFHIDESCKRIESISGTLSPDEVVAQMAAIGQFSSALYDEQKKTDPAMVPSSKTSGSYRWMHSLLYADQNPFVVNGSLRTLNARDKDAPECARVAALYCPRDISTLATFWDISRSMLDPAYVPVLAPDALKLVDNAEFSPDRNTVSGKYLMMHTNKKYTENTQKNSPSHADVKLGKFAAEFVKHIKFET